MKEIKGRKNCHKKPHGSQCHVIFERRLPRLFFPTVFRGDKMCNAVRPISHTAAKVPKQLCYLVCQVTGEVVLAEPYIQQFKYRTHYYVFHNTSEERGVN